MPRYIDADEFAKQVKSRVNNPAIRSWILAIFNEIPAADVAPVVHGKNISGKHPVDEFMCSECETILEGYVGVEIDEHEGDRSCCEYEFRYCPSCGAKMDGGKG